MIYVRQNQSAGQPFDKIVKLPAARRMQADLELQAERAAECLECDRNTARGAGLGRCKSCLYCGTTGDIWGLIEAALAFCPKRMW